MQTDATAMAFAPSTFSGLSVPRPARTCPHLVAPPIMHPLRCALPRPGKLSQEVARASPAIEGMAAKYLFPMRDFNTQVFFDNSLDDDHTLLILFAEDRHGLVLDAVSVLKALNVSVKRVVSDQNQALPLLLHRIEGELLSVRDLHLSLHNCVAFWVVDAESGDKIYDDGARLDQLTACLKFELQNPHPRPRPADPSDWHRVVAQKNRADRFTAFQVQTRDQPGLLAELTAAFARLSIDVASAAINTCNGRAENTFFVTKRGFKCPLNAKDIDDALEEVMRALLVVGEPDDKDTLWYQTRDGTGVIISEALFVNIVDNKELAVFARHATPNFRGRLPEAPYRPVMLQ